ncbi:DUF4388 domain-containing protein [Plesiocystis pacifica]|uniref:DUF4388 domain-containing protein n=1 Tax=Plesiocystis pacifica TaxID=191768 RepID=UPI0012FB23BD|nr:DUF4388 domain-containing protein [Plesiocystis pacifica]
MNPSSSTLTVLIAAHSAGQRAALSDILCATRPGLSIANFPDTESKEAGEPGPTLHMAMVVEVHGEGEAAFGSLTQQVRASHPALPIVVIAPSFDRGAVGVLAKVGGVTMMPSPCEPSALLRAMQADPEAGGSLGPAANRDARAELGARVAASRSGVLHVEAAGREGAIHIEEGQLVHAHTGELIGAAAVEALLALSEPALRWIAGRSATARTIQHQGFLSPAAGRTSVKPRTTATLETGAPQDVLNKISRLAGTPDILAAYLLRDSEVVMGECSAELDPEILQRTLSRMSLVYHDMERMQGDAAGTEIQATIGEHRLVLDRLGPTRLGFQIGVVVRQATPVCKSLRRLIRQVDRSFRRALARSQTHAGPREAPLHRVA